MTVNFRTVLIKSMACFSVDEIVCSNFFDFSQYHSIFYLTALIKPISVQKRTQVFCTFISDSINLLENVVDSALIHYL